MSRIPKIEQLKRGADFKMWITQFEGHLRALETENDKRLDILLSCLEGTAFSYLNNLRIANANITYAQVKEEFEQRFCGDDCKQS